MTFTNTTDVAIFENDPSLYYLIGIGLLIIGFIALWYYAFWKRYTGETELPHLKLGIISFVFSLIAALFIVGSLGDKVILKYEKADEVVSYERYSLIEGLENYEFPRTSIINFLIKRDERHQSLPVELHLEVSIEKNGSKNLPVVTRSIIPTATNENTLLIAKILQLLRSDSSESLSMN